MLFFHIFRKEFDDFDSFCFAGPGSEGMFFEVHRSNLF